MLGKLRAFFSPPTKKEVRSDGWENPYLGYGTSRDKVTYGFHRLGLTLSDAEIEALFYTDDVAAKIVELRPEEAFRRGYKLVSSSNESAAGELQEKGRELDIDGKLQEAWTWGRAYGGALLIVGAEGGGMPWEPLNIAAVREVRFLNVVDRRYAFVEKYYADPLAPNFGKPEVYGIRNSITGMVSFVHESRCIRFDGVPVDLRKQRELQGWSYSVLQRPYDVIRQFAMTFQAAGVLVADASQAVFKMKGLFDMVASGEKARLETRMRLIDMSRSAGRAVLLDSDGEDFKREATHFAGLPDMLDRFGQRLAASVDTPVTRLLGISPGGLNATGESDTRHWYDSIAGQQKKHLSPRVVRLYQMLSAGKMKDLSVEWCPLHEPTDKEKAEVEKTKAETDKIRIDSGVLYPQEVALARFGKSTNGEIEIDEDEREESLEAEKELAANPPDPALAAQVTPPKAPVVAKEDAAPAERPFAERTAAYLADCKEAVDLGLEFDEKALAEAHGIPTSLAFRRKG